MSRPLRRVLAAAVCSSLVLLQGPAVAAPMSTSAGTLTLAFTFEAFPAHKRAFQVVTMSGRLWNKQVTLTAWRHDGNFYTSVSSGLGDEAKYYCQGKASVRIMPKKKRVVMKVPVSCLPPGKVFKAPYPATGSPCCARTAS